LNKFKTVYVNSALAILLCATTSAFATKVTPPGKSAGSTPIPFSASGAMSLSKSGIVLGCSAIFTGTAVVGGDVQITSVAFNGPPSLCHGIKASATQDSPWTGHFDATTQLTLDNVAVKTPSGEQCGPSRTMATVSDNGHETVVNFNNAAISGGCSVTGSLTTTPYLHITH
jgi:hypothetical protein